MTRSRVLPSRSVARRSPPALGGGHDSTPFSTSFDPRGRARLRPSASGGVLSSATGKNRACEAAPIDMPGSDRCPCFRILPANRAIGTLLHHLTDEGQRLFAIILGG